MSLEKINEYLDRPENKKLEEIMQVNTIDYYEKELAKAKLFSDQLELELEEKNEECIKLKDEITIKYGDKTFNSWADLNAYIEKGGKL